MLDKILAGAELLPNVAMDVYIVIGVGEGLKADFITRLVLTGLSETDGEVVWSYRLQLRLLGYDEAYFESKMVFGRNTAQGIRAQVEPVN
jgi:hypothetical protein